MENIPVTQILKKAADKAGFIRVRYADKAIPTTISNVTILLFFGDIRSSFVLSSLLLRRFREEARGSKYFILASWPGYEGLFPYVDEYWELNPAILKDVNHLRSIYNAADGFFNHNDIVVGCHRVLNTFFEEVLDWSALEPFYKDGFTLEFQERFKHIKRFLPSVPSSNILGNDFNRRISSPGNKILIHPTIYFQNWKNGKLRPEEASQGIHGSKFFWISLVERLLEEGYLPVIWQDYYTYDLSPDFLDKCVYLSHLNVSSIMSGMRAVGCVLDLFSGISRLAIAARCPYICCEERVVFNKLKDYEVDDLCGAGIPREYLFLFPSICDEINKSLWNQMIFESIISKLVSLLGDSNRDLWPSPSEVYEIVPYNRVREIKRKKLGIHFIKVPKY